jgi:hypothetical protein
MLSDAQVEAIYKYVEDSYLSGYSATKAMVYAAMLQITCYMKRPEDAMGTG